MKEKIKVLATYSIKMKKKKPPETIEDIIGKEVPEMYEFIYGYDEQDIMMKVDKFKPEIIFLRQVKSIDTLKVLQNIKQLHPIASVFVFLVNSDDEQEMIDKHMAAGAYKCFFSALILETLIHDMYVALNLE